MELYDNAIYQDRYAEAIRYYQKALAIYEKINHELLPAYYKHLANLREMEGNYYETLAILKKAMAIEEHDPYGEYNLAGTYSEIASVYREMGEHDSSKKYLIQALNIYHDLSIEIEEADILRNIGLVAREQGNYEESLSFFDRALKMCTNSPNYQEYQDNYDFIIQKVRLNIADTKEMYGWSLIKKEV